MCASRLSLLCWSAVLLFVCFGPSATTAVSYSLYTDSNCTQAIPQGSYSNPSLHYQPDRSCLNTSNNPNYPTAATFAYSCTAVNLYGQPAVAMGISFYSTANCSYDGLLGGVDMAVNEVQTGVLENVCVRLALINVSDSSGHTPVWGNISVGAPATTPNSAPHYTAGTVGGAVLAVSMAALALLAL